MYMEKKYQDRLAVAWKKFITQSRYDYSFIRPEIFESWQMAYYYRVDPFNLEHHRLSGLEFKKHQELHAMLLKVAVTEIDKLYSLIAGSNVFIIFTDSKGLVLHSIGDEKNLVQSGPHTRLTKGSSWSLSEAGTNSIAMCLSMRHPVQVYGNEHYKNHYKTHTCSGAPIRNQKGELVATVNISAFSDEVTSHTLGMVTNVASTIENSLKLQIMGLELLRLKGYGSSPDPSQSRQAGIVLLDGDNQIMYASDTMLALLKLQDKDPVGKHILNVIKIEVGDDQQNFQFSSSKDSLFEIDCTISNRKGTVLHALLSIHYVHNADGLPFITVLTIVPVPPEPATVEISLSSPPQEFSSKYKFDDIIGSSHAFAKAIAEAKVAAKVASNVLLLGESGTGKELFAHAVHNASSRKLQPFVAINCGAIPKTLVESELFGYEKGAFTGAKKEGAPGKFEQANGGTIFLDEIGEMPLETQVALLRVLETRQVVRVGGTRVLDLNVRIIAATNKDLYMETMERRFREDLYYRLGVFLINIPPLRKRGDDVIELTHFFLKRYATNNTIPLVHNEVYQALVNHSWPGNVRELSNVIERAVFMAEDNFIQLKDLVLHYTSCGQFTAPLEGNAKRTGLDLSGHEADIIGQTLKKHKGNVEAAAHHLGVTARTLYRRLQKHKILPKNYKD